MRARRGPQADRHSKVLIIGSGPAGYTAAIYASRSGLKPILVEGPQPGGQLTITTDVENWPGDLNVQGPDLMARMAAHARHVGVTVISDLIVNVDLFQRPFTAIGDSGVHYTGDTVIIATGASARWLGLYNEKRYLGAGVSACATCDGAFFKSQHVAVVGGGNTAVEEALHLTHFASEVTLIHRRDTLRADRVNQDRLNAHPSIKTIWNSEVVDIIGDDRGVNAILLKQTQTGTLSSLPVQGVFVAIGHDPATSLFAGQIELDEDGYIVVAPGGTSTSVPGVFAAGDVQDRRFRQAVVSAGMGCMAALEAEKHLDTPQTAGLFGSHAASNGPTDVVSLRQDLGHQ
jgi:thioredoxin reductase (NADPH)